MKIGDYEILSQLGAGGMGRVYKVKNELSDRIEAMKVLLPDLEGQIDLANRFLREIKVQAGLDHPNIAKLYTATRLDNQLLMFMEYVEGMALDQRLREGPIPIPDALDYILHVLDALEYAHQRGVVHRDIKPANMMLMPDGRIKLLDFGIAKASVDSRLTMTGTTLGSLYYMAPEQIQGGAVDARSDLYSVGVSLYELVTGTKPFDGESQFAIMSAHLARPPVAPIQIKADVPPALSEIILLALSKDPASRFQSAGAFYNALQNVQPQMGAVTVPAAPQPRTAPRSTYRTTTAAPIPVPPSAPLADSVAAMTAQAATPQPPPPPPAPEPSPESFHLIEPSDVAAKKTGPRRLLWVAVGSLCAVGAIVAFIQFGPRGKTSAKETVPPVSQTTPAPNVETPAPSFQTATPQAPGSPPPSSVPSAPASPGDSRKRPIERAQNQAQNHAQPAQGGTPQPPQQPGQPARAEAPPPAAPPSASSTPSLPSNKTLPVAVNDNRLDVSSLSDQLDMMVVRAQAIRVSLNDLQKAQNAQGLSLRSDWVEAFSGMNNNLRKANQAINDGNAEAAKSSMSKAAVQIELLEKGLGR